MFHQPAGFHALVLGIRVPANVPQFFQRRVRIGLAPDETDGFLLQQEFALVPLALAPHDGNVGAAGLHLPHALPAVLTVDLQLDLRVVGGVLCQHFRQAVGGVINGSSDAQRTADDAAAFLQPLPQVLKILGGVQERLPCRLPGGCQGHAVLAAQEQGGAQFGLQVLQSLAQGRLCQIELLRRPGQVARLGKGQEDLQIFFIHSMFRPFFGLFFSILFCGQKCKPVPRHLTGCCGSS